MSKPECPASHLKARDMSVLVNALPMRLAAAAADVAG